MMMGPVILSPLADWLIQGRKNSCSPTESPHKEQCINGCQEQSVALRIFSLHHLKFKGVACCVTLLEREWEAFSEHHQEEQLFSVCCSSFTASCFWNVSGRCDWKGTETEEWQTSVLNDVESDGFGLQVSHTLRRHCAALLF